ncbi:MAG: hypothetical protein ACUVV3_01925 [Dehalococcoidia bacterium]
MSITANHDSGGRQIGQPPTAIQCALAVVTAGLAVAAVMLALVHTAQASRVDLPAEDRPYLESPVPVLPYAEAAPTCAPSGAQPAPVCTPAPEPSCPPVPSATYTGTILINNQPAADNLTLTASINGHNWATTFTSGGRFSLVIPQQRPETPPCFPGSGTILFTMGGYTCMPVEEKTGWSAYGYRPFTPGLHEVDLACVPMPTPAPTPTIAPTLTPPSMPMPVEGTWWVTCGYRCGLHTDEYNATFALDIVPAEGDPAGQPVRSPVDGLIIAIADSTTYFCHDQWNYGPEGGAAIVIDFQDPSGAAKRLRLAHLDPTTIPDDLQPGDHPVPVKAGTLLANVADIDHGCSHLHISLTRLDQGQEVPEPMIIEGSLLSDCGGDNCWQGAHLPPHRP